MTSNVLSTKSNAFVAFFAVYAEKSNPGGIRPGGHGQQPLCLQISARASQYRRDATVSGRENAGDKGMKRKSLEVSGYGT